MVENILGFFVKEQDADINYEAHYKKKETAAYMVVNNGHIHLFASLEGKVDLSLANYAGQISAHLSALQVYSEIIRYLMKEKSEVKSVNEKRLTPLDNIIHNKAVSKNPTSYDDVIKAECPYKKIGSYYYNH